MQFYGGPTAITKASTSTPSSRNSYKQPLTAPTAHQRQMFIPSLWEDLSFAYNLNKLKSKASKDDSGQYTHAAITQLKKGIQRVL